MKMIANPGDFDHKKLKALNLSWLRSSFDDYIRKRNRNALIAYSSDDWRYWCWYAENLSGIGNNDDDQKVLWAIARIWWVSYDGEPYEWVWNHYSRVKEKSTTTLPLKLRIEQSGHGKIWLSDRQSDHREFQSHRFEASDRTDLDRCFGNLSFTFHRIFMTGMAIHANVMQETR
jgi:hypothetical protein